MTASKIRQALVLAHQTTPDGRPIAALRVGGLPLVLRALLTLRRAGFRRCVVAAGAFEAELRALVVNDRRLAKLEVQWAGASAERDEGAVLLAAAALLRGDFLLVCADRVISPRILERLQEEPLDGITLATVSDGADPLRLAALPGGRGARPALEGEVGLPWAGAATLDPSAFDVLRQQRARGEASTVESLLLHFGRLGCARLAEVPDGWVRLVQDDASRRTAERRLVASLAKPEVDGFVARHLNRHVSLFVTRRLMNLPVRPNHITVAAFGVALLASLASAQANAAAPSWLAVGAVLWQLASMLDGVDGELARLRFQTSKAGEWLDTVSDDVGRMTFFLGTSWGLSQVSGSSRWAVLGLTTVALQLACNVKAYRGLLAAGAGSHYALAWTTARVSGDERGRTERLVDRLEFFVRRDFYILTFMCLTLVGLCSVAMVLAFMGSLSVALHDLARPRQLRDRQTALDALVRDEHRA